MLDRCLTAQLTATLKNWVCIFYKLKLKPKLKAYVLWVKLCFIIISTWLRRIKLSSFYFKTCWKNQQNKSPLDGHGNYNKYLLMKIKF